MAIILGQFIKSLVESGLMTAEEVHAFLDGLPPEKKPQDARQLAQELFRHRKLTRFQAQALYQGKTRGLVLGNYVVLDKLGAGGMGTVYKARHRVMKRVVALKVLPSAATRSPRAVKRFHREVEAAARLSHANIVTAHDADEANGVHFLVMECVEGDDLAAIVRGQGRLTVARAIDYTIQAAKGLEYAHDKNVIHRDIKPSNLVLDPSGTVKVLDMGLARINQVVGPTDSTPQESLTGTGKAMGTVDYMPPEQAENTKTVDRRADVYSLGCTLFYLLTGHAVYQAQTVVSKLLAHQQDPIPSLRSERDDVPAELDQVFQQMIAKRPGDRYGNMTQVIQQLERCRTALYEQVEAAASFESETPVRIAVATGETLPTETEETPADESLPLDLPVISPGDHFARPQAQRDRQRLILSSVAAAAMFLLLLVFGVVFTFKSPEGTSVAEVEQPDAEGWPDIGKPTITIPNESDVPAVPSQPATTRSSPPPIAWPDDAPRLAIAPFDEAQAKEHQQAWADYLGLPVEREIELPGGVKLTLVLIPPGEFLMGSTEEEQARFLEEAKAADDKHFIKRGPNEGPQHRVKISRPFYLGKYEVTQAQWEAVMGSNPSEFQAPMNPMEQVSWNDSQPLLEKLNQEHEKEGMKFVLPTEAQWEYACRAGTTTAWHCGNSDATLQENAWYEANAGDTTHAVGELKPNAWGLYDMHGKPCVTQGTNPLSC